MIITIASYKGGAGKTTTAVHLAAYLQTLAPTLLLDGDPTRNALNWRDRGAGFPFQVAPVTAAAKLSPQFLQGHIVIDTGQRPSSNDLREMIDASDLLILPATPVSLDIDGLMQTIDALHAIGASEQYRVLLTKVPPPPAKDASVLREALAESGVPLFTAEIPFLKAFSKAPRAGEIVNQTKDKNAARAWEAYAAAGKELAA